MEYESFEALFESKSFCQSVYTEALEIIEIGMNIEIPDDDEIFSGCESQIDISQEGNQMLDDLYSLANELESLYDDAVRVESMNEYYALLNSGIPLEEMDFSKMDIFYDKSGIGELYGQIIWNYLIDRGYTEYGAAAIMGNLMKESALNPFCTQGDYDKADPNMYNGTEVVKYDLGLKSKNDFIYNGLGGGGFGLAQWTDPARKQKLYEYAKEKGTSVGDIQTQLEYLVYELENSYGSINDMMKNANSYDDLRRTSNTILDDFENPNGRPWTERSNEGIRIFERYKGTHTAGDTTYIDSSNGGNIIYSDLNNNTEHISATGKSNIDKICKGISEGKYGADDAVIGNLRDKYGYTDAEIDTIMGTYFVSDYFKSTLGKGGNNNSTTTNGSSSSTASTTTNTTSTRPTTSTSTTTGTTGTSRSTSATTGSTGTSRSTSSTTGSTGTSRSTSSTTGSTGTSRSTSSTIDSTGTSRSTSSTTGSTGTSRSTSATTGSTDIGSSSSNRAYIKRVGNDDRGLSSTGNDEANIGGIKENIGTSVVNSTKQGRQSSGSNSNVVDVGDGNLKKVELDDSSSGKFVDNIVEGNSSYQGYDDVELDEDYNQISDNYSDEENYEEYYDDDYELYDEDDSISYSSDGSVQGLQQYARSQMSDYGWDSDYEFDCLVKLWNKESGWNPRAKNPSSGAYGIAQSYPASKMASAGSDYMTNGETQIRWGLSYIKERYGSPSAAWAHFCQKNWY